MSPKKKISEDIVDVDNLDNNNTDVSAEDAFSVFEAEDSDLVSKIHGFAEFLQKEQDAPKYIERIFSDSFDQLFKNREIKTLLDEKLSNYIGRDNTDLLIYLLQRSTDDLEFLEWLKKSNVVVEKVIRILTVFYGESLEKINFDENPNGWSVIYPKINYEVINQKWQINLVIEKVNGENIVFEETPSSILQLVNVILQIFNRIPSQNSLDISTLTQEDLIQLKETCEMLFEKFKIS